MVNSAVAPRIAPEQPPAGEDRPLHEAVLPQRVERVLRAGRVVLAAVSEQWAGRPAVDPDKTDGRISRAGPDEIDCSSYSRPQPWDKPPPRTPARTAPASPPPPFPTPP